MKIIEDGSGIFHIADDGTLTKFVPHSPAAHGYTTLESLTIPQGVTRIGTQALDLLRITGRIRFPESLRAIGTEIWEAGISWCDLPDVVIPQGVKEMTSFAFGKCYLRSLRLPPGITFIGGRHFKGSHIDTLYLPESCKNDPPGQLFDRMSTLAVLQVAQANNLTVDEILWYPE